MNRSLKTLSGLLVASALTAACGQSEAPRDAKPAPAPAPQEQAPAPAPQEQAPPPPPIDEAKKQALEADMTEARAWVEQARELKKKGLELERSTGPGAGRQSFSSAASLYTQAVGKMGKWCEPTYKEIDLSSEQRSHYVTPLANERRIWLNESATLGPLINANR